MVCILLLNRLFILSELLIIMIKKILLVGGSSHKVGDKLDLSNCYNDLENVAKSLYSDSKVVLDGIQRIVFH